MDNSSSTRDLPGEFPVWGLLPRKETGALNLITKNPTFDGRGVTIAIFDSGVDPSAPGLEFTPDNEVKVVDRIDASGAGDIDTATVVESDIGREIVGLTGRKLKIPETWQNPSKKYHLGVVPLFNLYPQRLRERVAKEKKEKTWDPFQRAYLSKAQKHVQTFEKNKGSDSPASSEQICACSNDDSSTKTPDEAEPESPEGKNGSNGALRNTTMIERLQKENAEAELALLKGLDKKYNDLGPTYDCVVFNDGDCWRACIDNTEEGDLVHGILLGEYRITHDFQILNTVDQYTISINVHNDGNILEIVGMCSSHGTHVASIAAGYFPDNPEKNGVAPGAKIVAITIGDNRLGSMETGTALVRAMARVMENPHYKVDIVNMSYGEHAHWSNSGRLGEIAHEVVNKYGVIWVASAGNHGPALCTVGVPPDFFSDSIIGVGAYVSPDMMSAEYSMTDKLPGRPYTWSSRGPTADGGRGVTVCAPGGAITSVPKFTLRNNQLMNGTSMASPHTAGCVALLVSAMKQKDLPYTPYSVRRAIQNTAQKLETDVFAQGHGLIKVDKALEYLVENCRGMESKVRFGLECGRDRAKGIHLRNWRAEKQVDIPVTIEPFVFDETRADPNDKLSLNFEFMLITDDPWVIAPPCLQLSYSARTIKVTLDPRGLVRGRAYFSNVKAYLASKTEKGPIFEIPVTMIVPHIQLPHNCQFSWEPTIYKSGHVQRHFIMVPLEATYAFVTVKASGATRTQRLTLHTVQIKPSSSVTTLEFYKVLNLGPNESTSPVISVEGGLILEVCLARWWSCLVEGEVELTVDFHGLFSPQETISFANSDGFHRVDVKCGLRSEELLPQAVLKHYSQVLMPSKSKMEVLGGERDTLPDGRVIYQIILTYNLTIQKSGLEVTPKCCLLNHVLYESSFESQLWMLFDANKQLLSSGDAFCSKYNCKLDKGSYTIKLQVRHEKSELLERLTDMPLTIITKLAQEVKLDVYSSYSAAVTNGRKVQSLILGQGSTQPFYIAPPNFSDKTLKSLSLYSGDCLLGTVAFGKDDAIRKAVSNYKFGRIRNMPDNFPLRVFITELPCKKRPNASSSDEKKELKGYSEYDDALVDFKSSWIHKLEPESSDRLYKEVEAMRSNYLTAMVNRLQALDSAGDSQSWSTTIDLSKQIIDSIDVDALLVYYGTKNDTRQEAAKIKPVMERQKGALLEALAKKGTAIYMGATEGGKSEARPIDVSTLSSLDNIAAEILRFVDPTDSKVINFFIYYYLAREWKALACRLLAKLNDEKPTKEMDLRLIDVFNQMDLCHVAKFFRSIHDVKFPPNFARF